MNCRPIHYVLLSALLPCALFCAAASGTVPGTGDVIEVSMIKLNNIEYEEGDPLPDWVVALDGEQVRISGFMRNGTLEGMSWFDLTNDSCGCGTSKLQHFVRITLTDGTSTFTPQELNLEGTFEAGEVEDEDGFVESIYRLEIESLDS